MTKRIDCIDGWRAIAALGVLYTHTISTLKEPSFLVGKFDLIKILNLWGSGVHLFFVISGFCFFLVMSKNDDYSLGAAFRFWKKRWLRIAPAFYVACIVYGLVKFGSFNQAFLMSLLANFIFLQTYIPNTEIAALFWSLSVEWLFYLVLPLIFLLIKRFNYKPVIAGILMLGLVLNLFHYTGYLYPNNFAWYYTIFANIEHFGWGILIGYIYKRKIISFSFLSGISGFFAGFLVAYLGKYFFYSGFLLHTGQWQFIFESIGPLIMTLGFSIMIICTLENGMLNKIMGNRIFIFIGRISYSFYLWHLLILETCFQYFKEYIPTNASGVVLLMAITLIFLIPVSYASYKLLESFYFKLQLKDHLEKVKAVAS